MVYFDTRHESVIDPSAFLTHPTREFTKEEFKKLIRESLKENMALTLVHDVVTYLVENHGFERFKVTSVNTSDVL